MKDFWIYSVIQGITEALPVSSSSHIRLISTWLGQYVGLGLESALHIGTGLAFVAAFPKSIWDIWVGFWHILNGKYNTSQARWWIFITLASLPVLAVGAVMHMLHFRLCDVNTIAVLCAGFGFVLWRVDTYACSRHDEWMEHFHAGWIRRACILGSIQMLALFPGVSRLGACLIASRYLGYSRKESLRISITLGVVSILACTVLEAPKWMSLNFSFSTWVTVISSTFLTCLCTLALFRKIICHFSFLWFFIYRCVLAGILLYLSVTHTCC